jgi:sugar lactone lactonase YvrE
MLNQLSRILLYISLATMLLVVLPGFPPYISFKSFKLTRAKPLADELAPNFILDEATPVEGQIIGAESLVLQGDILYTTVAGGDVLKVEQTKGEALISTVGRTGEPCAIANYSCGRPLGMRMDAKGNLVIADAYEGIVVLNPKTGSRLSYFSMQDPIDGVTPKIPNDLDVGRDGRIYWSDFSSDYQAHDFSLSYMGDKTGRLIQFDPKTKKNSVLISGLFGANGVQLSEKEDYVLVNEFVKARILRYYLKGPKAGTFDVFLDGLPAHPDNIRPNGRGGYFIALPILRSPAVEYLGPLPQLRKLLFRLQWFVLTTVSIVERTRIFDNDRILRLKDYVENFGTMGYDYSGGSVLEVDGNGNILAWYKTNHSEMFGITQVTAAKSHVYLNSIRDDKIWKISAAELRRRA